MKKLLILLFSILISLNSYGETLVCSYLDDYGVLRDPVTYKRDGEKFLDRRWTLDITIDNDKVLLLEEVFDDSIFHVMVTKQTKDVRFLMMYLDRISSQTGKCEILD